MTEVSQPTYKCSKCQYQLRADQKVCPHCGSKFTDIHISVSEMIKVSENLSLKKFPIRLKRFIVHLKQGWFPSDDTQKHPDGVQLTQLVDRENNLYKKKVVDEKTG